MYENPLPILARQLIVCVTIFLAGWVRAEEPFRFLAPVETLDNGVVTLQVAPKIGRIVSFHRKGEVNWLKVFDQAPHPGWNWNPWGGDRIWPTAQYLNPQIYGNGGFDPAIDGQPWEILKKTATVLEMRSAISPELGLRITHRIELVEGRAEVVHTFLFECLEESLFPVHAWNVTGLEGGDYILMESDPAVLHPDYQPFKWWREDSKEIPTAHLVAKTNILQVSWPAHQLKLGTYGRWVALVKGASAFRESILYDPKALYLEECSLATFLGPEISTYEIETLSPTWFLRKGEKKEWTVRWELVDFPEKVTDEEKAEFLQAMKD